MIYVRFVQRSKRACDRRRAEINYVFHFIVVLIVRNVRVEVTVYINARDIRRVLTQLVRIASSINSAQCIQSGRAVQPIAIAVNHAVVRKVLRYPWELQAIFVLELQAGVVVRIQFRDMPPYQRSTLFHVLGCFLRVIYVSAYRFVTLQIVLAMNFVRVNLYRVDHHYYFYKASFIYLHVERVIMYRLRVVHGRLPSFVVHVDHVQRIVMFFEEGVFVIHGCGILVRLFRRRVSIATRRARLNGALLF